MHSRQSLQTFKAILAQAGLTLEGLAAAQGFDLMLDFYLNQRADDCPPENGGDMLLYQWGRTTIMSDDWLFNLDLTRQFVLGEGYDDDIWQLSLHYHFPQTEVLKSVPSGDKWCPKPHPRAVEYFKGFIQSSAAYRAVAGLTPVKVVLDYFNAG